MEKKNEVKENINMFLTTSDDEVNRIMGELIDEALLANEIDFVNMAWEKISSYYDARKEQLDQTLERIKELQDFQKRNSGLYWDRLKQELTDHAFLLEPAVIELVDDWKAKEELRYKKEHEDSYEFHKNLVEQETEKFEKVKNQWESRRVRFHILKQEHAIKVFQERINSPEFVNPESRISLFAKLKQAQINVYHKRMNQLKILDNTSTESLTSKKVEEVGTKLQEINDIAQDEYTEIAKELANCIKASNNEMETAMENLREFLYANEAEIEEGMTYNQIIEDQAKPFVESRKQEAQELYTNADKYLEEIDDKMNEICKNIIEFLKLLASKYDKGKEDLRTTDLNFNLKLAQCADNSDETIEEQEEQLTKNIVEMKKAIHHVELNQKLDECFKQLDVITRMYRDFNRDYIEIVENYPNELEEFFEKFERNCSQCFKLFNEDKREEIKQLFENETAKRQQKLEDEAMKKYEEEKKKEEQKLKEDDEKNPKGGKKAPAKAPPKKGKEPEKPDLGVPQLEVPHIQEFVSINGYKYLVQRTTEEIAFELMQVKTEESEKDEHEGEGEDGEDKNQPPVQEKASQPPIEEPEKEGEGDKQEEPEKEEVNEYLEKAKKFPPEDPDGTKVLEEDLIIKHHEIKDLVDNFYQKMFNWISSVKEDS
jgi:hypothetical protein